MKLWQNPQSADTLTILCRGIDGYSTGYYMAPAQVASPVRGDQHHGLRGDHGHAGHHLARTGARC